MPESKIVLHVSEDDDEVAYLVLPGHPGKGEPKAVSRQVRLSSLMQYEGPDLYLDLDSNGRLIGVEVLI